MNLVFNFKDELYWIHNFLPKELYKDMYTDIVKNRNKLKFKKASIYWKTFSEEVGDMSQTFNQDNSLKLDYLNKYHTFLKHQNFVNFLNFKFHSYICKYNYGNHLAWHTDSDQKLYAATFYFNKTWGESWGGELMFKSPKGSGFIPITGNSLVIVKAGLKHKVNANLKKTHPRFSIQTWVNN
tara:strand:+ start:688 stop:1233 length:546 start_codon:yes stop_codon:yes gene_type:complete